MSLIVRKYRINPETLRYEQDTLPRKKRIRHASLLVLAVLLFSVFLRKGYESSFSTPRQVMYEKENAELRSSYLDMNKTLHAAEIELAEFADKDDRFYRAILSLDPVSSTFRQAGTGGAETHTQLDRLRYPGMIRDVNQRMDQLTTKLLVQSSSLENVYREAVNNQLFLASRPSIHPISPADPFWTTSSFGYRADPFNGRRTAHHGIDLAGPHGLDIHCTGDGEVVLVEVHPWGYGKEVIVDHGFGYRTRYAHLQDILVEKGQKLKRGQVLGTLGSSGRSTGPHLHYEVMQNGHPVNPVYFFFENLNPSEYEELIAKAN